MRKTLLTIGITILAYRLIIDLFYFHDDKFSNFIFVHGVVYPGLGISEITTGRCMPDKRDYNQCTKLQIKISDMVFGQKK